MQTLHPRVLFVALVAPRAGPVGRVVVDDENVDVACMSEYLVDQIRQIFDLVVRGYGNQRLVWMGCHEAACIGWSRTVQ